MNWKENSIECHNALMNLFRILLPLLLTLSDEAVRSRQPFEINLL